MLNWQNWNLYIERNQIQYISNVCDWHEYPISIPMLSSYGTLWKNKFLIQLYNNDEKWKWINLNEFTWARNSGIIENEPKIDRINSKKQEWMSPPRKKMRQNTRLVTIEINAIHSFWSLVISLNSHSFYDSFFLRSLIFFSLEMKYDCNWWTPADIKLVRLHYTHWQHQQWPAIHNNWYTTRRWVKFSWCVCLFAIAQSQFTLNWAGVWSLFGVRAC